MTDVDIRWEQRFDSYKRALAQLTKFIDKQDLNRLEEQGIIKAFEYTHELAWKLLKAFLSYQGTKDIYGSRDATRKAFNIGLIDNGEIWMKMIKDRNRTSNTYNQATAEEIAGYITEHYIALFIPMQTKMQAIQDENKT